MLCGRCCRHRQPAGGGKPNRAARLTSELSKTAASNKEFLDAYPEISIGHYYTTCQTPFQPHLKRTHRSGAYEHRDRGRSSGDRIAGEPGDLVPALRRWKPREGRKLLPEILSGIHAEETDHFEALEHAKATRTDEFCHSFSIPWQREDLKARRLDEVS